MKGVLFSADFAIDDNNDPRLLELNTDTVVYSAFTSSLALNNLTDVINSNSEITEFHILYKDGLHKHLVEKISASVAADCSNIEKYGTTKVDLESIYPTSPADSGSKFILRLTYDENAVFDSTYCKNNVNMLKLMYDNNATSSITEFYHSSSTAEVNSLSGNIGSNNNLPHYVIKTTNPDTAAHSFYSITGSVTSTSDIISIATGSTNTTNYIERFYYSSDQVTNNKLRALRSYNIMYGTNLDVIKLASGSYDAIFNFQTGSNFRELPNSINKLDSKYYYEFTNKFPQNKKSDGFLGEELIEKVDGTYISGSLIESGSWIRSFFYSGSPNTDDMDAVDAWSQVGYSTPEGSLERSASVYTVASSSVETNGVQQIEISGSSDLLNLGLNTRVMVYATSSNITSFVQASKIIPGEHFMLNPSSSTVLPVTENYFAVSNTVPEFYSIDVEPDDTFYLKVGNLPIKVSTTIHNAKEEV